MCQTPVCVLTAETWGSSSSRLVSWCDKRETCTWGGENFPRHILAWMLFCGCQMERGIPALLLLLTFPCCYLQCKHILAVYLSQALGACQELTVSEEQLTNILLAEEEDEG